MNNQETLFIFFRVNGKDYTAKVERVQNWHLRNTASFTRVYKMGTTELAGLSSLMCYKQPQNDAWYVGYNTEKYGNNTMPNFLELAEGSGKGKWYYFVRYDKNSAVPLFAPGLDPIRKEQRHHLRCDFHNTTVITDDAHRIVGKVMAKGVYVGDAGLDVLSIE